MPRRSCTLNMASVSALTVFLAQFIALGIGRTYDQFGLD